MLLNNSERETAMIKVSIIVPVYNSEKYLRRCLDSIIGQTLKEIEIICVNDGSTDSSPQILEEYANEDSRIKVMHKENGGAGSARKAGESLAQGQYLGYVDSDDWVEPEMYERLYKSACDNNVEIVTSGYFYEGDYVTVHFDMVDAGIYRDDGITCLRDSTFYRMEKKGPGLSAYLFCKLFAKNLVSRLKYMVPDSITMAEDKMFLLSCILECNSAMVLKEAYYHYMINPSSVVHTINRNYLLNVNEVYQYLLKLYQHPNFTENMRIQSELFVTNLLVKGINTFLGFHVRNLLWFDPYWLDKIPGGSRVVLYGSGEAGRKCRQQLLSRKNLYFAGCIDFCHEYVKDTVLNVQAPELLKTMHFDYIVITIKNPAKAKEIRTQLEELGVSQEKILWFEQNDLFWRYAEAEGLLTNMEKET